jgi:biopolymer transport protein ExbD
MSISSSSAKAEINITSLIDVLLVLLILFMVIHPALQKGLDVQVPPANEEQKGESRDQIVLRVEAGPVFSINGETIEGEALESRIAAIFSNRPRKVLFVEGAEDAGYADVVAAIDAARGADIEVIGLVPRTPTE